ncbi:hypothetical protein L8C07_21150 [Paenibacillus sp. CMAA1739]|uniref:hypothetical protein n=1 Tax=Paenibacillus ottowii TaxID=2315729 RepID=UPI00272F84A5|nr:MULTISPECIES: hypothetical protein [Paenibacillus]MDP1511446.1 hypothetical protein [Paenibacillus ottowii]MEC4568460.1 hypothetical protein [Paenibacillus sp. CMAA1739]
MWIVLLNHILLIGFLTVLIQRIYKHRFRQQNGSNLLLCLWAILFNRSNSFFELTALYTVYTVFFAIGALLFGGCWLMQLLEMEKDQS